ncbi:MAG TPA: alpha/beta hydrolase [Mycobacteriales bacterium]|nr:alpha/beta hydrolase [Mycobacteriales bacterium]
MGNERIVRANGVELCVEAFGDPVDPTLLLTGSSMLSWPEELCTRLAAGSRHVIRYDIRDTGRSISYVAGEPQYLLSDLGADVIGLLDVFDIDRAHLVGLSVGGWVAQLAAVNNSDRVASLTLIATRPTSPGANDPDLPEHSEAILTFFSKSAETEIDWADRAAVVDFLVERERHLAGSRPFDETTVRELAVRMVKRTPDMLASLTSIAFLRRRERWRERLADLNTPTLVIHGTEDPFFPYGNAVALASDIPGARLLPLERVGHELPRSAWDEVLSPILDHTSGVG